MPHNANISGLYIDCFAVIAADETGAPFTDIANLLDTRAAGTSVITTKGYKWIAQITNGNPSTAYNQGRVSLQEYTFRLCSNHFEPWPPWLEGVELDQYDYDIPLPTQDLESGDSIYIGWTDDSIDLSSNSSCYTINIDQITSIPSLPNNPPYLADQIVTNSYVPPFSENDIIVSTRIRLLWTRWVEWGGQSYFIEKGAYDTLGKNTVSDSSYNYSAVLDTVNKLTNNNSVPTFENGQYIFFNRRNGMENQNIPNTGFSLEHWRFGNIPMAGYLLSTAAGDPHITTIDGKQYKFDYEGSFRLFQSDCGKLIINGFSEYSKKRWKDNQYITKCFIYFNGKTALIDTGFRGKPVSVIHNDGIALKERSLPFNDEAEAYCYDCRKKYAHHKTHLIKRHHTKYGHEIDECVRNELQVTFTLQDGGQCHLTISNVNPYNLQPCRIQMKSEDVHLEQCRGAIIDRKYSLNSSLKSIEHIDLIDEPTEYDVAELPAYEIASKELNKKFI